MTLAVTESIMISRRDDVRMPISSTFLKLTTIAVYFVDHDHDHFMAKRNIVVKTYIYNSQVNIRALQGVSQMVRITRQHRNVGRSTMFVASRNGAGSSLLLD